MKNKKAIFILLPVVLIIWGLVAYRITSEGGDSITSSTPQQLKTVPHNSKEAVPDTFHLMANYRDPFLGTVRRKSIPIVSTSKIQVKRKIEKPKIENIQWPEVKYGGRILNQSSNKDVGILLVENEERLVLVSDELKGVKVNHIYKDSIEVVYNNTVRIYHKTN